jgi:ACS family hexuronate transporter-like MFS transporter
MSGSKSRWVLLAVLSLITIINYIDRQTVSILYPAMTKELHFPEQTFAMLVTLFLIAYTAMYAVGGWLVDRIGARNGLALALAWWSTATALTSLVHTTSWLEVYRVMLALGQPIVFSAGVKACAEFFPPQERAMATGIFSAGSGVGALVATPILAAITLRAGWRVAIAAPGLLGFLLVPAWTLAYNCTMRQPGALGEEVATRGWCEILRQRSAWALVLPRAIGDPLWYFCLFWIPVYLQQARHLDLKQLALFGWMPFLFADLGSIVGGSISDALIPRVGAPVRARIIVLLCIGAVAPLGALIGFVPSLWVSILLMGLVAFVSQCWTITTAALATDIFPISEVGTITGMMGTAGGVGAVAFSQITGATAHFFGFALAFVSAALLMPVAVLLLVLLLRVQRPASAPKPTG